MPTFKVRAMINAPFYTVVSADNAEDAKRQVQAQTENVWREWKVGERSDPEFMAEAGDEIYEVEEV